MLLIGGSTGTMLEALEVVGDSHDTSLGDVSQLNINGHLRRLHVLDDPSYYNVNLGFLVWKTK